MAHRGWGEGWAEVEAPSAPSRAFMKRPETRRKRSRRRQIRRRVLRTIAYTLLGALLITGASAGLLARDALAARDSLQTAASGLPGLQSQLRHNPADATYALRDIQAASLAARNASQGALWQAAALVPVLGANTQALATLAATVDSLATDVLPNLASAVQAIDPANLAPVDGRLDLGPLLAVADQVVAADGAVRTALADVAALDRAPLLPQLAEAADQLQLELFGAAEVTRTAAKAAVLIPAMLGADGPRTWVLLAQNNAEQRATGGIPGSSLLITADGGAVALAGSISGRDVGRLAEPVLPLTAEEQAIWGESLGVYLQNINFTPDFPRTAELAAAMWEQRLGSQPTGVISVDPVALQMMVAATGPVSFEYDGEVFTLTEANTAQFLLSDVYFRFLSPIDQDEVFEAAAEAVFEAVTAGSPDAGVLIDAVVAAAEQGRIMLWSADPAEQALLSGTMLSGELAGESIDSAGVVSPVAGVFLNLTVGSKIGFYLDHQVSIENVVERPDGSRSFELVSTLTNVLAPDAAASLPSYVVGNGPTDGSIRANIYLYAPLGGALRGVLNPAGEYVGVTPFQHQGLNMAVLPVDIQPGETLAFIAPMVSGPSQTGEVMIRTTPGPR